jgi:hypothetical protein
MKKRNRRKKGRKTKRRKNRGKKKLSLSKNEILIFDSFYN